MGVLSFLGGLIGKIFGGAGSVVSTVASASGDLVNKVGDVASAMVKDPGDLASARQFAAPGAGGGWFRSFVDSVNCAIRPGIVIYLMGLIAGWWTGPDLTRIDPTYKLWFEYVMTFYFGQRALMKDLPTMVAAFRAALRA
jgi:hypothetical protein